MPRAFDVLEPVIDAIGTPELAAVAAHALSRAYHFYHAAVVLHGADGSGRSQLLFESFGDVGAAAALEAYCTLTHRMNPMLYGARPHAARARDFGREVATPPVDLRSVLAVAPEEELGFRTVGWPAGLEEVGLYVDGGGGLVEISLYRPRERVALSERAFAELATLAQPLAAVFRRHATLHPTMDWSERLSPREIEVAELLRLGCSTEAVAQRLALSQHTVKDHRKHLYRKLGISSLAELFAMPAHAPRQAPSHARGIKAAVRRR